jgi:hypothetical protein
MMVRRILFVMLMAVAPVLGVLSAEPARADSLITSSFDTEFAHPGDTVNLTVTFTNPETVDVTFAYLGVSQTWRSQIDGTKYSVTGCTGEISWCDINALHFTAPIAPGATRTATLTYQIAPDSACAEYVHFEFFLYNYRESTAGAFGGIANYTPSVIVLC